MTPRATARLQLHAEFPLDAARAQLDYYASLGISHLYLSPITQARPGSMHGYDVLDPGTVSVELGGIEALERLANAARDHGMGLILDIVPNHMAADARNPWWRDVLQHGSDSSYSAYFDIDWSAQSGKVLLPILTQSYDEALRAGEIRLEHHDGVPVVMAGDQALPVSGTPDALALARYDSEPSHEHNVDFLCTLLERQHYHLAHWRSAANKLNWRRFFEVSELVGLRVEDLTVFNAVHALPLFLYKRGLIDGLRIDHVDGLAEPGAYLRQLRAAMREAAPTREPYIVVEKILAPQESLDPLWPVEGSSGYDFMDDVGALLHDPSAHPLLLTIWQQNGGNSTPLNQQLQHIRRQLLGNNFVSERQRLLAEWFRLIDAAKDEQPVWDRVISAWLSVYSVYRSYAEDHAPSVADKEYWNEATQAARSLLDEADFLRLMQFQHWLQSPLGGAGRGVLERLQQITPPLAAKSLEDTLYYRHGALLSRNEVGAWPQRFALDTQEFHDRNQQRSERAPIALLATATHDHKRGEDTRARLAVLTEIPGQWGKQSAEWLALGPDTDLSLPDRYMLLQTLVGAWPAHWATDIEQLDAVELGEWLTRVRAWQTKALREAKQHTTWTDPDADYESAAHAYLDILESNRGDNEPLQALATLAWSLVAPGQINSLVQTLLRNTSPGVPDLYQGTDLWDYSLVDPDNRRPVDYDHRRLLLQTETLSRPQSQDWRSGAVKQVLIRTALQCRAAYPSIFQGEYRPLHATGPRAKNIVAFVRGSGKHAALVVVPRLCSWELAGYCREEAALTREFWNGTTLRLPEDIAMNSWRDLLGQQELNGSAQGEMSLTTLFAHWPVALCTTAV